MSNNSVGTVYQQIIRDVVESSRVDFEEGGVDEGVLDELSRVSTLPSQIARTCRGLNFTFVAFSYCCPLSRLMHFEVIEVSCCWDFAALLSLILPFSLCRQQEIQNLAGPPQY